MIRTMHNNHPAPNSYSNYMWRENEEDRNIPYHAREDSTPFTYVRDVNSPNVLRATLDRSSGNNLSKVQTGVYLEPELEFSRLAVGDRERQRWHEDGYKSPGGTLTYTKGPNNSYFYKDGGSSDSDDDSLLLLEDRNAWSPKSSDYNENFSRNGDSTWLQKQQQKLQEKKERQQMEERQPYKSRMLTELKSIQTRKKPPVDEVDFRRDGSASSSSRHEYREDSVGRERPFMRVKRAYEQYNQLGSRPDYIESDSESLARPETPGFPVHTNTPYSNISTSAVDYYHERGDRSVSRNNKDNYESDSSTYYGSVRGTTPSKTSTLTAKHHEVSAANVKIARDTSKYWYKPNISREEAIRVLSTQPPGSFLVRNSNSFPGAFGLALKVSQVPPHLAKSNSTDELIRHFLIEPSPQGVRLKGSQHEPVFSSLPALIYQHSITQIALPCCLKLPESDFRYDGKSSNDFYIQGAACNVLYICSKDTESLTGPEAMKQTVNWAFRRADSFVTTVVHFKVDGQGITLTDNKRKLFFRRHYPTNGISYCGLCPEEQRWLVGDEKDSTRTKNQMFAFVARKPNGNNIDNQCHLFVEMEPDQPATAIVNFVNRVLDNVTRSNLV